MGKEITLMFSGGIDSTYCAVQLAEKFDVIHLLNYSNGYGHFFVKKSEDKYLELKKIFSDKFVFKYFSIKHLFEKILINNLHKDMSKYSSAFIWCLGCKLAMHARTIAYDKANKIRFSSDGSSYDSSEMVEQTPFSLVMITEFYRGYGIKFEPVAYKISRKEKIKKLKELGLSIGISFMRRNIGIQPKCIPGELYYSPYLIMGYLPFHQNKEIYHFYKDKLGILKSYIKNELAKGRC